MYKRLWRASEAAQPPWVPDRHMCPRLEPDDLRRAAQSFPSGTATSYGNFHPRHLMLLDDDGLDALALLLLASEAIGMLPKQLSWIQMPMLGKPSGGIRLAILYAAVYRTWQRARKPMVDHMHAGLDRRYWGASRGRSATDCAWLRAVRSESNQVAHKCGVLIVADW
eukprot:6267756-Pyramimonas_sp.AAC.1